MATATRTRPEVWDGKAAERIVQVLREHRKNKRTHRRNALGCFGVPIDNLTLAETVSRVERIIEQGTVHQHVVVNVDILVKLQKDPALQAAVLDCDSSMQTVNRWCGRPAGEASPRRAVTGIDLLHALIRRCAGTWLAAV